MIKNIVFDVGNVLVHFCWKELMQEKLGIVGEVFEHVSKATVLDSKMWSEFDRSKLSDEEIINGCIANDPAYEKEIRLFFDHIEDIVLEYVGTNAWISGLKQQGYRIFLLSNYGKTAFEARRDTFTFYPMIDGEVISYQVHELKPEPPIYQILMKKYSLKPEETVFLDDRPENVETAISLGWGGIVVESQAQAQAQLEALLDKEK